MQGTKKSFRIEQISKKLGLKKSTLRDWEQTFNISRNQEKGSNRLYTSDDFTVFAKIKDLSSQKNITKEEIASTVSSLLATRPEPVKPIIKTESAPISPIETKEEKPVNAEKVEPVLKIETKTETPKTTEESLAKTVFFAYIKKELIAVKEKLNQPVTPSYRTKKAEVRVIAQESK